MRCNAHVDGAAPAIRFLPMNRQCFRFISTPISRGTDLPHLVGLGFVNQQLVQGSGVPEQDQRFNPALQSRWRSAICLGPATSRVGAGRASDRSS